MPRFSQNAAKFIRENKSPEGKSVEFLDFGDFRKILSMLFEIAKLESTASNEFC